MFSCTLSAENPQVRGQAHSSACSWALQQSAWSNLTPVILEACFTEGWLQKEKSPTMRAEEWTRSSAACGVSVMNLPRLEVKCQQLIRKRSFLLGRIMQRHYVFTPWTAPQSVRGLTFTLALWSCDTSSNYTVLECKQFHKAALLSYCLTENTFLMQCSHFLWRQPVLFFHWGRCGTIQEQVVSLVLSKSQSCWWRVNCTFIVISITQTETLYSLTHMHVVTFANYTVCRWMQVSLILLTWELQPDWGKDTHPWRRTDVHTLGVKEWRRHIHEWKDTSVDSHPSWSLCRTHTLCIPLPSVTHE